VTTVASLFGVPATPAGAASCPEGRYQESPTFANGQTIVNDCELTLTSVTAERAALTSFVWPDGFPSGKRPTSVDRSVPSPIPGLANLRGVQRLNITIATAHPTVAYHFIPAAGAKHRLVIVHQGHACSLADGTAATSGGLQRTIQALLSNGYAVLGMFMTGFSPVDCFGGHDTVFQTTGNRALRYFLEPVAASVNYLQAAYPRYDFSMLGLSGGGWTTTLYAAIDPRITLSMPIAGSLPLYLRFGGSPSSEGDTEQTLTALYAAHHYPDLYVLGASGAGRRQVQVLGRRDPSCFGEPTFRPDLAGMSWQQAVRDYETRVSQKVTALGPGAFSLRIDETTTRHQISPDTITNVILPNLASTGLQITTRSLPIGRVGQAYRAALAATGGPTPYRWTKTGKLPKGLKLDAATGVVSGTPKAPGTSRFTVKLRDAKKHTTSVVLGIAVT
jgi:hypothetical protein